MPCRFCMASIWGLWQGPSSSNSPLPYLVFCDREHIKGSVSRPFPSISMRAAADRSPMTLEPHKGWYPSTSLGAATPRPPLWYISMLIKSLSLSLSLSLASLYFFQIESWISEKILYFWVAEFSPKRILLIWSINKITAKYISGVDVDFLKSNIMVDIHWSRWTQTQPQLSPFASGYNLICCPQIPKGARPP